MILKFTNTQIFFATSQCFGQLHFRLQTHLQDLVLANSEPEYAQEVTITPTQLAQVYRSVSTIAEGEARKINGEMKASLVPQLMQLAGGGDVEALEVLGMLQEIDAANEVTAEAKIESGKQQILAQ